MIELNVIVKGNKFNVNDLKGRLIYSIKPGMGGKMHLHDASGYKLYYFVHDKKAKKPSFNVCLDQKEIFTAECTSLFLDPGFIIKGENISMNVVSQDRREFLIKINDKEIGSVTPIEEKKEIGYNIKISPKYFDDYVPLIAVFIDLAFGKMNKG